MGSADASGPTLIVPSRASATEGGLVTRGRRSRLSLDRAINVRNYLRNLGVDPNRMIVIGRGEREPIASNDTASGRAQNRRVEILLSEPTARG